MATSVTNGYVVRRLSDVEAGRLIKSGDWRMCGKHFKPAPVETPAAVAPVKVAAKPSAKPVVVPVADLREIIKKHLEVARQRAKFAGKTSSEKYYMQRQEAAETRQKYIDRGIIKPAVVEEK